MLPPIVVLWVAAETPEQHREVVPMVLVAGKTERLAAAPEWHSTVAMTISNVRVLASTQTAPVRAATKSRQGASSSPSKGWVGKAPLGPERRPGSPPCDGSGGGSSSAGASAGGGSLGGLLPSHRIPVCADHLTGRLVARADRARSTSLVSRVEKPG